MALNVYEVNAFADSLSSGNPAGVCLLAGDLLEQCRDDAVRQKIAAKVGLSETAFLEPVGGLPSGGAAAGQDVFSTASSFVLRWFTPTREVPLCGHATLAAAAVLFAECGNPAPALKFETASGLLVVARGEAAAAAPGAGADGPSGTTPSAPLLLLRMSLPLAAPGDGLPPSFHTELVHGGPDSIGGAPPSRALTALLWPCLQSLKAPGVSEAPHQQAPGQAPDWPSHWLASVVAHVGFAAPLKYLLVVLQPQYGGTDLAALTPDTAAMGEAVSGDEVTGVIVATGGGGATAGENTTDAHDLYLRFFAPWAGIPEDPVTGSAFTVAGPYFADAAAAAAALQSGAKGLQQQQLRARQCSARGGEVTLDLGAEPGRVVVAGQAVMAARSQLQLGEL